MRSVGSGLVMGSIVAPSSKSVLQRAVAASTLAAGTSVIKARALSDDVQAAIRVATALGARVNLLPDRIEITGGGLPIAGELYCGESGLCLRMFSAVASLFDVELTLTASSSLSRRPAQMITEPLSALGVSCSTAHGLPPVTVRGPMQGGEVEVDGSVSSQFLTGLLIALPSCAQDSLVVTVDLKSKPYVLMTVQLLRLYGIRVEHDHELKRFSIRGGQRYMPVSFTAEGDWSGASFPLVAGAIGGKVKVTGLDAQSSQADRAILIALERAGAGIEQDGDSVTVEKQRLEAFEFDATDSPDLFPPLAALAANCSGTSVFKGVARLTYKESDRAAAIVQEFGKLGCKIDVRGDEMEVVGGPLSGGEVDSHGDHRIAMATAVAALTATDRVDITGAGCVAKSYTEFFDDLISLGAMVS